MLLKEIHMYEYEPHYRMIDEIKVDYKKAFWLKGLQSGPGKSKGKKRKKKKFKY